MRFRDAAPALGVFLVALAYLLLLRPYGFQLEDEGTLLSWFDRVSRGQRPYLDFHTGYTPGFFAFGSAVYSAFGPSAAAVRTVLAVMNALSAAGLAELTRRAAGAWLAPVPALLWLAFVPVYGGEFAAFNIPYPTWPVTLAWIVVALALVAWIERPRLVLLAVAGLGAAAAMGLRPNSGAFALAASTWIVVATASRRGALDRLAAPAAAAFMALGVWYTFDFRIADMDAIVHLVPLFAMAFLFAGPLADRTGAGDAPGAAAALAVLAAAFVLPTLAWTLPLLAELGRDRFLYEVFLVGAGYQTLYHVPHPAPEPYAALAVAALALLAVGGRIVARGLVKPLPLVLSIAAVGAVAKLVLVREALWPEGAVRSVVAQLENASFWLAATASYGAAVWLARVPRDELRRSPAARATVVIAPLAVAMYAQMFPRSDFMHQVSAVPLTAVAAAALLARVASWWERGEWPRGWSGTRVVRAGVLVAAFAIVGLSFGEKVAGPVAALSAASPRRPLPSQLDVHVEAAAGDDLAAVAATVAFVRAHSDAGEALWSFPATSGLLFAAGRANLAPHDYWYPGRPDHAEEARVLALLRETRPRLVITLNRGWNFFADSPAYFGGLRRFAADEYRLAARHGRYDVLARRDLGLAPDIGPPPAVDPDAALRDAIEENLERRRQAAWRWMDVVTPRDAARATLPEDRRDAVLLLRALRDGGDMRGAAWAVAGFGSADARVRGEAVDAMIALERSLRAARARFANDFDAAAFRPFVAPLASRARELLAFEPLRPFAQGVIELAGEAPEAGTVGN